MKPLPCPFCGFDEPEIVSNGIGDYFIRCSSPNDDQLGCGARTSDANCESEKQALKRWNSRAY